ncbi:MAG: ammonium transporter [Candidatus Binatia bacterium]|nr:MAG: ammonium transporter [Candidatus Binatia bacterium]
MTFEERKARVWGFASLALAVIVPATAGAQAAVDSGDTAWVLTASALVLMMTLPGLALFYGGLVRAKNVLNVLMQCYIAAGVVGLLWVLVGYSLAFSGGNSFIGDLAKVGLHGVTVDSTVENFATPPRHIPEYVYVMFQAMFAVITPALILGAIAERMRFSAWMLFITLWFLVVYCPIAHMVWSTEGWIFKSGAIDFAGGLVVHMSSGFSALAAAIVLGPRRGYGREPLPPHNLPLCLTGAGLLWTGWFGFNAGSALSASGLAALAFTNTNTATATAVVAWVILEWLHRGKPTALGAATAAVAGLVAITPACGNVSPLGAIGVGLGVTLISYLALTWLKPTLGYDDSLDVFGVHALGGAWGALASGIFATTLGSGIESNWQQIGVQMRGIVFVAVFAPAVTLVLLWITRLILGSLRVADEEEVEGLDFSQHGESAYTV